MKVKCPKAATIIEQEQLLRIGALPPPDLQAILLGRPIRDTMHEGIILSHGDLLNNPAILADDENLLFGHDTPPSVVGATPPYYSENQALLPDSKGPFTIRPTTITISPPCARRVPLCKLGH